MTIEHDFHAKWESIINEVSKTDVPVECLKKVVIRFTGGRQRTINLQQLQRQGLDLQEIEELVSRTLAELDASIRDVEFVVDVGAVANIIQPETDQLLRKICKSD
jgi:archaellum component FlaC